MTVNERKFIECVRKDPKKAQEILKVIFDLRQTSSKKVLVLHPKENEKL